MVDNEQDKNIRDNDKIVKLTYKRPDGSDGFMYLSQQQIDEANKVEDLMNEVETRLWWGINGIKRREQADLEFDLKMAQRKEWLTVKNIPQSLTEYPLTPVESFSKEAFDATIPNYKDAQFQFSMP